MPHSQPSGRRFLRHALTLSVKVVVGDREFAAETVNLGFGGLYLDSPEPLPFHALVTLHIDAPGEGNSFELSGRVIRLQAAKDVPRHGVAVEFYGTPRAERRRWVRFVGDLESE